MILLDGYSLSLDQVAKAAREYEIVGLNEAGIGPTVLSNGYPNPANSQVTIGYSVPAGTDGTIVIRDVLGSAKKTVRLDAASGKVSINTSDLSSGIYFYSLEVNGKTAQTKKLVVRH